MTPVHLDWTIRFVRQIEERIALYGRIGVGKEGEAVILACLGDVVVRHRALLAADDASRVAATAAVDDRPADVVAATPIENATAWSNPVFWAGGRFNPFAGTHADRMLASAATCRRLGYESSALGFERHAAEAAETAAPSIDEIAQANLASVAAFTAGPQIEMFA